MPKPKKKTVTKANTKEGRRIMQVTGKGYRVTDMMPKKKKKGY